MPDIFDIVADKEERKKDIFDKVASQRESVLPEENIPSISQAPETGLISKLSDYMSDIISSNKAKQAAAQIELEAKERQLPKEDYMSEVYPEGSVLRKFRKLAGQVGQGTLGTAGAMGGFVDYLTGGAVGQDFSGAVRQLQEEHAPTGTLDIFDKIAAGLGSSAMFFVPGLGIINAAAKIPGITAGLASTLGATASGLLEAGTEAGSKFQEIMGLTADRDLANKKATEVFWLNAGLNPLTNKLGALGERGGSTISKFIKSALSEGTQEFAQDVISSGDNIDIQKAGEAGLIGGTVGGLFGGTRAVTESIIDKVPDAPFGETDITAETSKPWRMDKDTPVEHPEFYMGEDSSVPFTKRSDIVKLLQKELDPTIRQGRISQTNARSIYKPWEKVIRTRSANDLSAILHEQGHHLVETLWPTETALTSYQTELLQNTDYQTELNQDVDSIKEGVAEYVRRYVTVPEGIDKRYPTFHKFFETELDIKSPGTKEVLQKARQMYYNWTKMSPDDRILAHISIGDKPESSDITTGQTRPVGKIKTWDDLYTATIDDLNSMQSIQKEMGVNDVETIKNPYKLMRLMKGWFGKAESYLWYKPFDFETYKFEGESLGDIVRSIPDFDEFRKFVVAQQALIMEKEGKPTGIDHYDALYTQSKYWNKYNKYNAKIQQYQKHLVDYLLKAEVISPELAAKLGEKNVYIPFYRVMEEGAAKSGLSEASPIKWRKGSERDIVDPLESIIKNTYAYIWAAERNFINQAVVNLGKNNPGLGEYIERLPTPIEKINLATNLSPEAKIIQAMAGLTDNELAIFRPQAYMPAENQISVFEKGERKLYQVHPDIYRSLKNLDREQMNFVLQLMKYPARWLRVGATLTPEFALRNVGRDQFSAMIFSNYGYRPGIDFISGLTSYAKKDINYWQRKIAGGGGDILSTLERSQIQATLEDLTKPATKKALNLITNPLALLETLSGASEQATRLGEFKRAKAKEGDTKAGLLTSAFSSRNVSVDFRRGGGALRTWNAITAFFNPGVQGTERTIAKLKEAPLPTTLKLVSSITLPSLLLYLHNKDEEWYKEQPFWVRDTTWAFKVGSTIYRYPKPGPLGIVFGSLPERIAELVLSEDPHAFDELMSNFTDSMMPNVLPTAAVPLLENYANKSYFTGRKLVPESREKVLPQFQYQPYTSETAKALGNMITKIPFTAAQELGSPAKIENLIRGWTGGTGMYVLKASDAILGKVGVLPVPNKPAPTAADMPVLKGFVVRYPNAYTESVKRFYDNYNQAEKVLNSAKILIKDKPGDAVELIKQNNIARIKGVKEALSNIDSVIMKIYETKTLTPQDKRNLLDELFVQKTKIAQTGNMLLNKIGKK